jgi:tetratricopeptide (TPR) repeat protein
VLQSLKHAKAMKDSSLIAAIYCSLGNLKGNFNFYDDAEGYYKKSLGIFLRNNQDSSAAVIYNNLGALHDMMYPDSLSNDYYLKAVAINKKTNNYLWLAISYINIGINFTELGKFNEALQYLNQSLQLAKKHDFIRLYPWVYNNLSFYFSEIKDYARSVAFADTALDYARGQSNSLQERDALKQLSDNYLKISDLKNAYNYLEQYSAVKDSINKRNRLKEIEMLELKYKFDEERKQQELEKTLIKHKHYRKEVTYVIIILIAGFAILALLFVYILQRNRMRRRSLEQKNTILEKETLSRDLEYRNKELTTNVMYLLKKNEFISSISDKLKLATDGSDNNFYHAIERIITELDKSVSDLNWGDFEMRFQEVYVGFYNKLNKQYPALTPNDLRMCAFLRLNMTSKEISDITFQSPESLKTARYRLRKKLGLCREENLVAFLVKF